MTSTEINKAVKKLKKDYLVFRDTFSGDATKWSTEVWKAFEKHEDKFKEEILRLYRVDPNFDQMSKGSVLILMSLNCSLRAIAFHVFCKVDLIRTDGDFK